MAAKCGRGKIRREAYTRNGTRVASTCIIDRGKKGKGPKTLPKPRKGSLYGWKKKGSNTERHGALLTSVRKSDCETTISRLTLLRNISADRGTDAKALEDQKWLRRQPICRSGSKALKSEKGK